MAGKRSSHPSGARKWRRRLEKGDEAELIAWVKRSGLERVARVAAALASDGEHPEKLDTLLLLQMAHLRRKRPELTIHAAAAKVAAAAHPHLEHALQDSLTTKLERHFKKRRNSWAFLSESAPVPSRQGIADDLKKEKPAGEYRARERIVELLPSRVDLYDYELAAAEMLVKADKLAEADKIVLEERLALAKKLGRRTIEPMLQAAAKRMKANPFTKSAEGKTPRSLLDLIGPDLEVMRRRRNVGREMAFLIRG